MEKIEEVDWIKTSLNLSGIIIPKFLNLSQIFLVNNGKTNPADLNYF